MGIATTFVGRPASKPQGNDTVLLRTSLLPDFKINFHGRRELVAAKPDRLQQMRHCNVRLDLATDATD